MKKFKGRPRPQPTKPARDPDDPAKITPESFFTDNEPVTPAETTEVTADSFFSEDDFNDGEPAASPSTADDAAQSLANFEADDPPRLVLADVFDKSKPVPPLTDIATPKPTTPEILAALAALLIKRPSLLKKAGLPDDPRWTVECLDGGVLGLAGYGVANPRGEPVVATELHLTEYTSPGGRGAAAYAGSSMPSNRVFASVRSLLSARGLMGRSGKRQGKVTEAECESEVQTEAEIEAGPPPSPPPAPGIEDDYFGV